MTTVTDQFSPPGTPRHGPASRTYPVPPGYGPPPAGVPLVGAGVLGRRRNPILVWIVLPLVTLLVYHVVWVYRTNRELGQYDPRIKVSPGLSVLAFTVGWIVLIPPFVEAWRMGSRVRQAQGAAGLPPVNGWLLFLSWLVGVGPLVFQLEINRIWDCYPGAVEGQQVPLSG